MMIEIETFTRISFIYYTVYLLVFNVYLKCVMHHVCLFEWQPRIKEFVTSHELRLYYNNMF